MTDSLVRLNATEITQVPDLCECVGAPAVASFGIRAALLGVIAVSLSSVTPAQARTIGGPDTARFLPGVLADQCTLSVTDGQLAFQNDRTIISSDQSQFTSSFIGSPTAAGVNVATNLGSAAVVIADQARLVGPSLPTISGVSLGGSSFGPTSVKSTDANGNLISSINVRFESGRFASGTYEATAVVTCTDDGTI